MQVIQTPGDLLVDPCAMVAHQPKYCVSARCGHEHVQSRIQLQRTAKLLVRAAASLQLVKPCMQDARFSTTSSTGGGARLGLVVKAEGNEYLTLGHNGLHAIVGQPLTEQVDRLRNSTGSGFVHAYRSGQGGKAEGNLSRHGNSLAGHKLFSPAFREVRQLSRCWTQDETFVQHSHDTCKPADLV